MSCHWVAGYREQKLVVPANLLKGCCNWTDMHGLPSFNSESVHGEVRAHLQTGETGISY